MATFSSWQDVRNIEDTEGKNGKQVKKSKTLRLFRLIGPNLLFFFLIWKGLVPSPYFRLFSTVVVVAVHLCTLARTMGTSPTYSQFLQIAFLKMFEMCLWSSIQCCFPTLWQVFRDWRALGPRLLLDMARQGWTWAVLSHATIL